MSARIRRSEAAPVSALAAGGHRPVEVSLLGLIEHAELGDSPYRIDADGAPYVPAGDGGIVLGLRLGDSVFALFGDHAAPGACLTHPVEAARHALALYCCIGNEAVVRTGAAAGARGAVIGKRGENGRVIAGFRAGDLARMRPGDQVSVRSRGQGVRPGWLPASLTALNIDPGLLAGLPVSADQDDTLDVAVRLVVPARMAGNGLGRPAHSWDLDLQLASGQGAAEDALLLGDLVAVTDLDARYNMGYRRDWVTIGVAVHGSSPLPGHGPGITPILTGPRHALRVREDSTGHVGLTESMLGLQ
ncbi:MAG TPA: DUF4438 domain-containing protein [Streptosporangiaceae bacterium]|nr:DUF4438 domain-containing protein [Streptosporangiaceae bacterium]